MNDRKDGYRSDSNRNRGFGFKEHRGPVEMSKAVCADCKQECEVPFKPSEDRPVYCKECYGKHRKR